MKTLLLIFGGVCLAALGGSELLASSSSKKSSASRDTGSRTGGQVVQLTSITIKVVYFGMSTQITGTKEEYLTLESPVYLDNVLTQIKQEHAVLVTMLPLMQIVVNGVPAQDNPMLQDKTEVDLIPIYAGGSSQFEFSKILVAVDGSENARRALEVAVQLSRHYQCKSHYTQCCSDRSGRNTAQQVQRGRLPENRERSSFDCQGGFC